MSYAEDEGFDAYDFCYQCEMEEDYCKCKDIDEIDFDDIII